MNPTLNIKLFFTLIGLILGTSVSISQCMDPDLPRLSWSPNVPGTDEDVRIIVAMEYPSDCGGLASKGDVVVDHDNRLITVYFDQFCNDTLPCTQRVHCDTAHYIVSDLDSGTYDLIVLDTVSENHICDTVDHEMVLDSGTMEVRNVFVRADSLVGKPGTIQCIPYSLRGFKNVNTFQVALGWDTLKLRYDTVRNLTVLNHFTAANFGLRDPGDLRVIWIDFDVDGETLPNGTTLFEVCFELVGSAPDTADIIYNREILNTEIENVNGDTLAVKAFPGQIIISEDFYPQCEADTADILCHEWVMDTVMNSLERYCQTDSGYFRIEHIDWRGWDLIKVSRGYFAQMGPIGQEIFFTCEGERLGFCTIGGFAGGYCDVEELGQDTSLVKSVWSCGETLPGCYTTSLNDQNDQDGDILRNNLVSSELFINGDYVGRKFEIYNSKGQRLDHGTLSSVVPLKFSDSGIYWIRSGKTVQSFVLHHQP